MKLLALSVLMMVMQASPPVPRKTTNSASSGSHNIQNNSGTKQSSAQRLPAGTNSECNKPEREQPAADDKRSTVVISESTRVSEGKDTWDILYVIFTGLLVIVGAVGIRYAVKTLGAIERQANIMTEQADLTRDKERARIDIKPAELTVETIFQDTFDLKTFVLIRNIGSSRAFLLKNGATFRIDGVGEPVQGHGFWYDFDLEIPNGFIDVDTATYPHRVAVLYFPEENTKLDDLANRFWESHPHGPPEITLAGFIEYETMGTKWHCDFNYKWASHQYSYFPRSTHDKDRLTSGHWAKEDNRPNGEYQIKQTTIPTPPYWWRVREWVWRLINKAKPI